MENELSEQEQIKELQAQIEDLKKENKQLKEQDVYNSWTNKETYETNVQLSLDDEYLREQALNIFRHGGDVQKLAGEIKEIISDYLGDEGRNLNEEKGEQFADKNIDILNDIAEMLYNLSPEDKMSYTVLFDKNNDTIKFESNICEKDYSQDEDIIPIKTVTQEHIEDVYKKMGMDEKDLADVLYDESVAAYEKKCLDEYRKEAELRHEQEQSRSESRYTGR